MKVIRGDLISLAEEGEFDVIVHGCNCFNTMGSGLARQIRERYPEAYSQDLRTIPGDINKLGTYTYTRSNVGGDTGFIIVNAYTQYDFNRHGSHVDVFEYTAFQLILEKFSRGEWAALRFGFPMIGTGLACGNSERILALLEGFDRRVVEHGGTVTIVEYHE